MLPGIGRAPVARSSARENGWADGTVAVTLRGLARASTGRSALNAEEDVLVERDAELLGTLAHLIAVQHRGRTPFLELLLDRRDLEVSETLDGDAHSAHVDQNPRARLPAKSVSPCGVARHAE